MSEDKFHDERGRVSALDARTGYEADATRMRLRFPVGEVDPNTEVIRPWDVIINIANAGLREGLGRPSFPLRDMLADEPPEERLTDAEEAAVNVAVSMLQRCCALGLVRCGYVEQEVAERNDENLVVYQLKAGLFDRREFEHLEFLWDGTLYSEDISGLPADVFLVCADVDNILGTRKQQPTPPANAGVQMTDFNRPRRGPRSKFKEDEFWAIVACMADLDNLPDSQAEFLRQIDETLMSEWKDTPGDTWLKKRAATLYRVRSQFRRGNRD